MDDSKIQGKNSEIGEFLGFDCKNNVRLPNFIINLIKFSLFLGAEKVLMARKLPGSLVQFESEPDTVSGENIFEERRKKAKSSTKEYEKVCEKTKNPRLQLSSNQEDGISDCNDEYLDVSKAVNCPSEGYNEFPLNIFPYLAVLVLKLVGFQMSLVVRVFTFPVWLSYFSFMLLMFPFKTLTWIRKHLTKKLLEIWVGVHLSVASFIYNRCKAQIFIVNLALRFVCAFFWSIYVCFMLVGLLMLGFVISGLSMRRLVEAPIQTTETLNFDYTRASPVAFVPIMSSPGCSVSAGLMSKDSVNAAEHVGMRIIPYEHKLQLTISLTLPESEYNRQLGVFQVRVEFLSANGKITTTSSYPCMLRYKSQPIRFVETIFKGIPLITGFQSEVQSLNVRISDFTEGYEPTACLRVILEQRAEYQPGAGIPEIYSASLALESELPQFKRIIWSWRRTAFIWTSIMSFLMELLVILIFCRPIILPRGRRRGGAKKLVHQNKISW